MINKYLLMAVLIQPIPVSVYANEGTTINKSVFKNSTLTDGENQIFDTVNEKGISLEQAVSLAQKNDPWLYGSQLKQSAIESRSIASGTLPDPKISMNIMNVPTDSWDLSQDNMTQFQLGVFQVFSRGDSLTIKQTQLKIESSKFPILRANRKAKLQSQVSQLWLDVYLAQQTIKLIEGDWALFEQVAEMAKVSYSSVVGKTRQQDVIRAELEILQLEDRLTLQKQMLQISIAQLNEWLHINKLTKSTASFDFDSQPLQLQVADTLPNIPLRHSDFLSSLKSSRNQLAQEMANHPMLLAVDVKRKVLEKNIELAKQKYQVQWGANATYGYRDNALSGETRSDLFSVGVTFDLPLFTDNKQDKEVAASILEAEAVKTERLLLTKQMISAVEKEFSQLKGLLDRQVLYQKHLLKQTQEQTQSSLTAYTNDDGSFSDVVRARISELNARISALKIDVDTLKTIARINYFFVHSPRKADTSSILNQPRVTP